MNIESVANKFPAEASFARYTTPESLALNFASKMPNPILLGRYRLEHILGEGGMGVVWEATHLGLDTKVAVKLMREPRREREIRATRLLREARAVATIDNPHVVRMLDVDETADGYPFLVMERLRGADVAQYLREHGPISPALAAAWMLQACVGLAEAHARGIIHRDLKPANLFLAERRGDTALTLLDFGVCRVEQTTGAITQDGATLGSPTYMAPEQFLDAKGVDARADVWAIGAILYELVTGIAPFSGDTLSTIAAKIAASTPEPPSVLRPEVSELEPIILRCLEKNRDARFANVHELAVALEPFALDGNARASDVERILFAHSDRALLPSPSLHAAGDALLAPTADAQPRLTLSRAESHGSLSEHVVSNSGSPPSSKRSSVPIAAVGFAAAIGLLAFGVVHFTLSPTPSSLSATPSVERPPEPSETLVGAIASSAGPTADAIKDAGAPKKTPAAQGQRPRDPSRDPLDMVLK